MYLKQQFIKGMVLNFCQDTKEEMKNVLSLSVYKMHYFPRFFSPKVKG